MTVACNCIHACGREPAYLGISSVSCAIAPVSQIRAVPTIRANLLRADDARLEPDTDLRMVSIMRNAFTRTHP